MCSVLMYFAERDNPNAEMNKYYNSIPSSMWMSERDKWGQH